MEDLIRCLYYRKMHCITIKVKKLFMISDFINIDFFIHIGGVRIALAGCR